MTLMDESLARESIVLISESLHARGYVPGSSGNISVRVSDGLLVTPTNSCLGRLDPSRIAKIDDNGQHVAGDPPSKEAFLHSMMYGAQQSTNAVVHLHSTYAVAVSCRNDLNPENAIPALTPYSVMKIGKLRLLPYFPPGDSELAHAVESIADSHHAILLANHGPIVAGKSLDSAVYAIEELEEAAKLFLILDSEKVNLLTSEQIQELESRFPN